ncbi:hypothetical protein PG988_005678 [Apiospora saccharicola]
MTVYDTSPIGSQTLGSGAHVTYGCNTNWSAATVYRTLDVPSSTTSSSPGTTTTSATPASSTSIAFPTSTGTGGKTDAATPTPAPSQAWIAGAVVGPIVGCALVGLLVWWIMRQRMKKAAAVAPAAGPTAQVNSTYGQHQPGSHWPASSPPPPNHEWEAQHKTTTPLQELSNTPGNIDHAEPRQALLETKDLEDSWAENSLCHIDEAYRCGSRPIKRGSQTKLERDGVVLIKPLFRHDRTIFVPDLPRREGETRLGNWRAYVPERDASGLHLPFSHDS